MRYLSVLLVWISVMGWTTIGDGSRVQHPTTASGGR